MIDVIVDVCGLGCYLFSVYMGEIIVVFVEFDWIWGIWFSINFYEVFKSLEIKFF